MRRRWIADEVDLTSGRAALTGDHASHLARVLRAAPGQEFDIVTKVDGQSIVRLGRISSVTEQRVEFELGEQVQESAVVAPVTLLLAVFKFDRMEWAIEKAVELGVEQIIPVVARRTEKHLATAADKRSERWRRIAHEAAQQSRRNSPPEISNPLKLEDAIQFAQGVGIVLAEAELRQSLKEILEQIPQGSPLALAVGPEGGWTADETKQFSDVGWRSASLGPTILRAETAAIAALAVVMAMAGKTRE
ncbi:MAG TPA: RsmE family RNA methyltransferase [Terriglobales bacterium]|nr:RsmE family RNA methyltransferase [Terriglobales bacterium]